jgi:hypothetical protein
MKRLKSAIIAVALVGAIQAYAVEYTLNFSGGGSVASGEIDIVGGLAISGILNVTAGANQGTFNLLTGGPSEQTFRTGDGTDLNYDNVVNLVGISFLDGDGLAFANGPAKTAGTIGFNIWGNGDGTYTLFGDPPWGAPYTSGSATLVLSRGTSVSAPDGGSTMLLLGSALTGLTLIRRKFRH